MEHRDPTMNFETQQPEAPKPAPRRGLLSILMLPFRWLWTGADTLRKVLHLFILLFVFAIFVGAMSESTPMVKSKSALLLQPQGAVVEEYTGTAYDRAIAQLLGEATPQTRLSDLLFALDRAADDSRIQAVVLDLSSLGSVGMSKLQRLGDAIDEFKDSGKPVLAVSNYYSQGGYYLAARATGTYMKNDGFMFISGFGSYRNYYKTLIDKLMIDWNVFRVGTHKSMVEPYIQDYMSDEDRESLSRVIDQLWATYTGDIETARQLPEGTVATLTDNIVELIEHSGPDLGEIYVDAGLIDEMVSNTSFRDKVLEHVAADGEDDFRSVGLDAYLDELYFNGDTTVDDENVGVVIAAGEILNGTQPPGLTGGESASELLRQARLDDSVKAVVLRVDSPGGSVSASRQIAREVQALRESGKPVVVSMSSSAASGGYWISMRADRIFASASTITGSIGVFGMFPTFSRTLDAIGVSTDGVGTTKWVGQGRPDREMSQDFRDFLQAMVTKDYDDFITRVAEHRELDKEFVDSIGQGQIWTGTEAYANGLVDEIGSLDDAIDHAASLAGIEDDFGYKVIETELSASEQLAVDFLSSKAGRAFADTAQGRQPSATDRVRAMIERALTPLISFNDPRGSYAHCFCAFE